MVKRYNYRTSGVCSSEINFDISDGIVKNVEFIGGCNGNAKGLGLLAEGMSADELISKLKGVTCGRRNTSCPDQLSKALEKYSQS